LNIKVAPSVLAADLARLVDEIERVKSADYIHIDIMDGHFVPNITMGPAIVAAIKSITTIPLDVHLMVKEPDRLIPAFCDSGADIVSVHVEASTHLDRTLELIRESGASPALAVNPATPLCFLEHVLPMVEMVLLMTVNPGFGGQTFLPYTLKKIYALRQQIVSSNLDVDIEVDGGINTDTVRDVVRAGANVLVAGTAIFKSPEPEKEIALLKQAASMMRV
jgi:ribulose-phosphate 3-epimerase